MKKMIYRNLKDWIPEILYQGNYKGYNFYIVSYQVHPCAYVEVGKDHRWFKLDYSKIEDKIDCHFGLTYSDNLSHVLGTEDRWFFGWDYAHAGDYEAYYEESGFKILKEEKKWTTEEIFEEVKNVIEQFIYWDTHKEEEKNTMVSDEMLILAALEGHVRVNVTIRTVEIYDDYGVKTVLRDLDNMTFDAFKSKFTNF